MTKFLGESSGSENPGSIRDQGKIFEHVPVLYIFKIPMAVGRPQQSCVEQYYVDFKTVRCRSDLGSIRSFLIFNHSWRSQVSFLLFNRGMAVISPFIIGRPPSSIVSIPHNVGGQHLCTSHNCNLNRKGLLLGYQKRQ